MSPIPLSQWADRNGIPRRTAYNWANAGTLPVPVHRTLTGRLMVLEDAAPDEVHPFVKAYADAAGAIPGEHTGNMDYAPLLEAWGISLYDSVAEDLRPLVLQLAVPAASRRPKLDVGARFADWLGRIELVAFCEDTGFPRTAEHARQLEPITDGQTFRTRWPTTPAMMQWRKTFDQVVEAEAVDTGRGPVHGNAVDYLTEDGLIGCDHSTLPGRRHGLVNAIGGLSEPASHERTPLYVPIGGLDLRQLRALYAEPMFAIARPVTRRTAATVCATIGWDPDSPMAPEGHPLFEMGHYVGTHAAQVALLPYEHAAHLREIEAFRRVALGQPIDGTAVRA